MHSLSDGKGREAERLNDAGRAAFGSFDGAWRQRRQCQTSGGAKLAGQLLCSRLIGPFRDRVFYFTFPWRVVSAWRLVGFFFVVIINQKLGNRSPHFSGKTLLVSAKPTRRGFYPPDDDAPV